MISATSAAIVDGYRAAAVGDGERAVNLRDEAASIKCTGVDGAVNVQVLDHGILDESEWRGTCLSRGVVEGQRVAIAIEGALE